MTNLTMENFAAETEQTSSPVLVGFCGGEGDRSLLPMLALEREHPGKLKFCRVDTDRERALASAFHILSVPTLVLMQQGQVLQRIRGLGSKESLARILDLN